MNRFQSVGRSSPFWVHHEIVLYLLCLNLLQKKQAYFDYMVTITTMLGTNNTVAKAEMQDVLEFETKLANVSENIFRYNQ